MRVFGHPLHPMLVHFPIVLWTVGAAAYVVAVAAASEEAFVIAKLSNGAGLLMAILAMVAGLVELRAIEGASKAMPVAIWHMMTMATAWFCNLLALMLPMLPNLNSATAQVAAAACAGVGFLLMGGGGWLGGRLVYEFGIAVKPRAP